MTLASRLAALALVGALAACSQTPVAQTDPAGAGAAGSASALDPSSIEYFRAEVGDRVFFAFDSSALDFEAQTVLRRQAEWLRANPGRQAVIEGHADERGTRDYNLALGARRAAAVRNFLVGEGVEADRLRSVTFGKERPEALCSNESCWSVNRRGVTVMTTGAGV